MYTKISQYSLAASWTRARGLSKNSLKFWNTALRFLKDYPMRNDPKRPVLANSSFAILLHITLKYSRSSRKRPPEEFEKMVVTRAGRWQEWALVSDPIVKQEGGRLRELQLVSLYLIKTQLNFTFIFLDQNNHGSLQFHISSELYVKDSEWSLTRASKQKKSQVG